MLTIKAEAPAGLTIKQAIEKALELSAKVECAVEMEINDIPMLFTDNPIFGETRADRIQNYYMQWQQKVNDENKN